MAKTTIESWSYAGAPRLVKNEDGTPSHVELDTTINAKVEGVPGIQSTGTTVRLELPEVQALIEKVEKANEDFIKANYPQ